jgi:hypothetical protein
VIGSESPVNASPIAHPFTVPVAVPNAGAAAKLSKLLVATRDARTAQLAPETFVQNSAPYEGNETLSWEGSGVAGFNPDRAAVSYQALFYKVLATSEAVVVNSKLYVHHVGLTVAPASFGFGATSASSFSSSGQWLEGPLPAGPLGVVTANFVSLLGDLPLMLDHGATVGTTTGEPGYVVTLPKTALVALYEAHGLPPNVARGDVNSLRHFVCEIEVSPGGAGRRRQGRPDECLPPGDVIRSTHGTVDVCRLRQLRAAGVGRGAAEGRGQVGSAGR